MSEDGNYNAMVTGKLHAIYVSKRGIELIVNVDNPPSVDNSQLTCRLDRSVAHTDNMLHLAQTAMLHNLPISLHGYGDDRDDTLEFDELRISGNSKIHG